MMPSIQITSAVRETIPHFTVAAEARKDKRMGVTSGSSAGAAVRRTNDELLSSILVGTDDGNRPSDRRIEVFDRNLVFSHERLCSILDG